MAEKEVQEELLEDEQVNENNESSENVEGDEISEASTIESLKAELEKVTQEKEDLYQKFLRAQADFDNFRRRTKKERENDLKYKSQDLAQELIPVVDNFDRALKAEVTDEAMKNFVDGMNMIYRQLQQALEKVGVEEIESLGEAFDPNYHQAVMQVSNEEHEPNTVIEVLQKGYRLKDRVIRPAMVKVNQ